MQYSLAILREKVAGLLVGGGVCAFVLRQQQGDRQRWLFDSLDSNPILNQQKGLFLIIHFPHKLAQMYCMLFGNAYSLCGLNLQAGSVADNDFNQ